VRMGCGVHVRARALYGRPTAGACACEGAGDRTAFFSEVRCSTATSNQQVAVQRKAYTKLADGLTFHPPPSRCGHALNLKFTE
jgi:hypothetical protein